MRLCAVGLYDKCVLLALWLLQLISCFLLTIVCSTEYKMKLFAYSFGLVFHVLAGCACYVCSGIITSSYMFSSGYGGAIFAGIVMLIIGLMFGVLAALDIFMLLRVSA